MTSNWSNPSMAFKGVSLFIKRCYSIAVKPNNEGNEDNRKMSSYVYIQAQHLIKNKQTNKKRYHRPCAPTKL